MAFYTKRDLIKAALKESTVMDADQQTASGTDHARAREIYDQRYDYLAAREMAYWPNTNDDTKEIPSEAMRPITFILAGEIAAAFGLPEISKADDGGRLIPMGALGYRELRQLIAQHTSGQPTRAEYF